MSTDNPTQNPTKGDFTIEYEQQNDFTVLSEIIALYQTKQTPSVDFVIPYGSEPAIISLEPTSDGIKIKMSSFNNYAQQQSGRTESVNYCEVLPDGTVIHRHPNSRENYSEILKMIRVSSDTRQAALKRTT